MTIYLHLHKEPATPHSCLASVSDRQSCEETPCKCCGAVGCYTTVPCLPQGKKPTAYIIFWGVCAIELFSWKHFSHVFPLPLVACGISNSIQENYCSLESCAYFESSMSEVLLSKIFWVCRTNFVFFTHMLHSL